MIRNECYPVSRADRTCNICGDHGRFRAYGRYYVRPDARCAGCKSLERHRWFTSWFEEQKARLANARTLDFAPEPGVAAFAKGAVKEDVTADLFSKSVDHNWNIAEIDRDDNGFDFVICCHVLEHVEAEKALREMRRCLKPGGTAATMIPICEGLETTSENPSKAEGSKLDRWLHFQQSDHVRVIGRDFRDQVRDAGFEMSEYTAGGEAAAEFGLNLGEKVFVLL